MRPYNFYMTSLDYHRCKSDLFNKVPILNALNGPSVGKLPSLACPINSGATDGAILLGFPTTRYAGYRIRTEEDLNVHDSPIQGRISEDCAKTLTRARLCNL